MTEANYRLILGFLIIAFLYVDARVAMFILLGIVFLEGLTGQHIPAIISRRRYGSHYVEPVEINPNPIFNFYAFRALRITAVLVVTISYGFFPEVLWPVPWFVGFMLYASGITNLCPMGMLLRKAGFK